MSGAEITLLVVAVLVILGVLVSNLARRLDALHKRVINSRAVLDAQLVRRAELAMDLASCGVLDEASTIIVAESAWEAGIQGQRLVGADPSLEAANLGELAAMTTTGGTDRGAAESNLTAALRGALGDAEDRVHISADPAAAEILTELEAACNRVRLARRFHNEAVASVLRLRRGWLVRTFRLAGRAALPAPFEMDDAVVQEETR